MKRWGGILAVILAVTFTADFASAQRREGDRPEGDRPEGGRREGDRPREGGEAGRPGGERGEGGRGGQGGRGGRPGEGGGRPGGSRGGFSFGPSPIQAALDADKDGVISAKEIENAVVALRSLDKNKDGKLDRDELRPPRPEGGFGGGTGGGRPGEGGGRPGGSGQGGSFADRLLAFDKNKDGKITKEEAPEFLKQRFDRMDTNKDGSISKAEIEELAKRFSGGGRGGSSRGGSSRGGRPGGEGDRPARPEGGDRPARPEGGDRPRRPSGDDA